MRAVVIDDSKTQATRLAALLRQDGFEVEVTYDGEQGLRACAARPPDVVVSDILMPGIDGFEVCRRLKTEEATASVPVMLLTSLADPTDVVRALAAGADNFTTKPPDEAVFIARVRRMVERGSEPSDPASVELGGERFRIDAPAVKVLEVLVSSLEDAARRNADLVASERRLAREKAQREELMEVVAHELRNPLNALLTRASLVEAKRRKGKAGPEDWGALAEATVKQVGRMVKIIGDLQDATHIESGELRIDRAPVDLAELVRDGVERFRGTSAAHEVAVAETPPSARVEVDAARVEQVLANLLTNAIKYSPRGGRVEVKLVEEPGAYRLSVRDEGIGISPEALPLVFGRHYRAPRGKEAAGGSGLGLYVSKRLVELHGGEIGVTSVPERGSTFFFTLPKP